MKYDRQSDRSDYDEDLIDAHHGLISYLFPS